MLGVVLSVRHASHREGYWREGKSGARPRLLQGGLVIRLLVDQRVVDSELEGRTLWSLPATNAHRSSRRSTSTDRRSNDFDRSNVAIGFVDRGGVLHSDDCNWLRRTKHMGAAAPGIWRASLQMRRRRVIDTLRDLSPGMIGARRIVMDQSIISNDISTDDATTLNLRPVKSTKSQRIKFARESLKAHGASRHTARDERDGGITRTGWWLDGVYLGSDVLTAIAAVNG